MNMININTLNKKSDMHPLTLFVKIAKAVNVEEVEVDTSFDNLLYIFKTLDL